MITPGQTVRYWRDAAKGSGWHFGTVVEVEKHVVVIRPLAKGKNSVRVPISDVREVEESK